MAEKVKFGLSNVHIALRTESEGGVVSYSTPVALKGARNLTITRSNEKAVFRADNVDYYVRYIASSKEATFEVADIPDWFKIAYLGYKAAADDYLVETDAAGQSFAMGFQVENNEGNKKYVVYNCQAAQSDEEHKTTEENDLGVQTSNLNMTIAGEVVDGYVCYIKEVANFDSIEVPTFPESH